ncbi:MAG: hypothetical protein FWC38_00825 [Proteobacteria bacterium]|nr:hypothetical protein [Pseudomonadota bacterium]MCL2306786.1 hypothetical protein [Pseudomonadota bacterium]
MDSINALKAFVPISLGKIIAEAVQFKKTVAHRVKLTANLAIPVYSVLVHGVSFRWLVVVGASILPRWEAPPVFDWQYLRQPQKEVA